MAKTKPELDEKAKNLRKNMTKEEGILWHMFLKNLPVHFYRQRVIGNYIVDFYCPSARLVLELDGSQHYTDVRNLNYDKKRTDYLEKSGYTGVRFQNTEVTRNLCGVCDEIEGFLKKRVPEKFCDMR